VRLVVREAAEADIAEAARWHEQRSPGLGSEVLRAVEVTLAEIARMPARHPLVRGRARRALLRRFPYSVVFVASRTSSASSPACTHGAIRGIGRSAANLTANKHIEPNARGSASQRQVECVCSCAERSA
jgi:plasmid stabilization system protein ParE